MVRGAPEGTRIMMAPGHEEGFGFLRGAAIDQHVNTRDRAEDLRPVLREHPTLLGIALDESTAIIVRGDACEIAARDWCVSLRRPRHRRWSWARVRVTIWLVDARSRRTRRDKCAQRETAWRRLPGAGASQLPSRFFKAIRYFSCVLAMTSAGSLGAGGFWSHLIASR